MIETQHSYKDIIPVFLSDFKKDFDCKDIEDILRTILTKKEVDYIIEAPHPKQIYLLFWTLRNQENEIVKKFVEEGLRDSQEPNYGFLQTAIQRECNYPSLNTERYISEVDRLFNDNQKFTKYNVPRIEPYLELQKALLELRPSKNVVVEGDLGAGKQWLVLDVCSSYIVQRKMDFNIFWLDVRNCTTPEKRLEMLQSLLYIMDNSHHSNCDKSVDLCIERVKTQLRDKFRNKSYKNCLLVLRNVQNKETWEAFNVGCKILLTTRHKSVVNFLSPATTTHITLNDVLTPFEIETLFAKYLDENLHKSLKKLSATLTEYQKTNPLLLSTIAESIRDGHCTIDNWEQKKCDKLTTIIETTLNVLDTADKQLFQSLFIFPASAQIPLHLLGVIWTVEDPIIVVNKFYKYSLVKKHFDDKRRLTITLSSIYCELQLPIVNESELNRKIIEYYNILEVFDVSSGLTLPHMDSYFNRYIAYHLSKLDDTDEQVRLFRKIFLDFRFLDQKIRNEPTPWNARGYVLHTLQVLRLHKAQIVGNDTIGSVDYDRLVNELLVFLLNAEEKLIKSEFTCLLQIALMSGEGAVYDEAYRQAQQFPDYVWFTERGRFNEHRQIINLGKIQVQHAIYLDDDYCLLALSNQQLLLTDISLEGDMTYLLNDEDDTCTVIEMRMFNNQKHLLTLYSNGSLKLWSLRQLLRRRNIKEFTPGVAPLDKLGQPAKNLKSLCNVQFVNSDVHRLTNSHADQKISAFHLDEKDNGEENNFIQLHVAFSNGDICICDWENKEEKFRQSHTPILKTQERQIRCFSKVLDRFYVLCTIDCQLTLWDLRRGSKEVGDVFQSEKALSIETHIDTVDNYTMVLLIFKKNVWKLRFNHADHHTTIQFNKRDLPLPDVTITCGRLSNDGRYLVLGTTQGLIVYDLKRLNAVLRSNISEHIICLDVYDLNGPRLKYIVLCGAAGKGVLHLYTLRNVPGNDTYAIAWAHKAKTDYRQANDIKYDLEPNVYLMPLLKMSDGDTLFTVDSKSRIYKIQTDVDQPFWSTIITPQVEPKSQITALCVSSKLNIYAGYDTGVIINITEKKVICRESNEKIDYLKVINDDIIVASSKDKRTTKIFKLSQSEITEIWPMKLNEVVATYARVFGEHILLLFWRKGVICIDLVSTTKSIFDKPGRLVGFDLRDDLLFLAFEDNIVKVFKLSIIKNKLKYILLCQEHLKTKSTINYLSATFDSSIVSIGFKNGNIKIYMKNINRLELIYTIIQGHEPCHEMKLRFSPCKQILVSCAEQLRFWDVKHIVNNRVNPKARSRRFNQEESALSECEEVDASPWSNISEESEQFMPTNVNYNYVEKGKADLWKDKRGNAKLPELLASIKFVGNRGLHFYASADFKQFFVLDDELVFYHFKVLDFAIEERSNLSGSSHIMSEINVQAGIHQKEIHLASIDNVDELIHDGIDVVGNGDTSLLDRRKSNSKSDDLPNLI